jgi:endonuclease YncB( thermonuclease family)
MRLALVLLAATLSVALPVHSQTTAQVIDGDTIRLNGTTWRIRGIDAPEMRQTCADGWRAGEEAKRALVRIIGTRKVTCEEIEKDRYGRTVGICRAEGIDVGAAMVRQGFAWAFTRYSWRYLLEQWLAWWDRVGVHARSCEKAWDWRNVKR